MSASELENALEHSLGVLLHNHREPLFVSQLRARGFTTRQIAEVVETLGEVCHRCWDADYFCQCSNDD